MNLVHAQVLVSGKVQGVGYRYSTVKQARRLRLQGWVKNLPDGRVEAVFEGESSIVGEMIQWCHRGPSSAIVSKVDVEMGEWANIKGFDVKD